MDRKGYWIVIFLTMAVNVIMLQWTIEAYYGLEYGHVFTYTIISLLSVAVTAITYARWRKAEYKK